MARPDLIDRLSLSKRCTPVASVSRRASSSLRARLGHLRGRVLSSSLNETRVALRSRVRAARLLLLGCLVRVRWNRSRLGNRPRGRRGQCDGRCRGGRGRSRASAGRAHRLLADVGVVFNRKRWDRSQYRLERRLTVMKTEHQTDGPRSVTPCRKDDDRAGIHD